MELLLLFLVGPVYKILVFLTTIVGRIAGLAARWSCYWGKAEMKLSESRIKFYLRLAPEYRSLIIGAMCQGSIRRSRMYHGVTFYGDFNLNQKTRLVFCE